MTETATSPQEQDQLRRGCDEMHALADAMVAQFRAQTTAQPETIWAPADNDGTLVDTGFHVGEGVIVTAGGEEFIRTVLGPAAQPHERIVYDGPQWGRRIEKEPALWVAPEGCPDLARTAGLSQIARVGAAA